VDVGRVDVAVAQAEQAAAIIGAGVHVVQALERLHDDADRDLHRQHVAGLDGATQDGDQLLALEELHGDEVLALQLAEVVGVDDVLVGQRGGDAGLVEEHLDDAGPRANSSRRRLTTSSLAKPSMPEYCAR
jgi:hypothetical protein